MIISYYSNRESLVNNFMLDEKEKVNIENKDKFLWRKSEIQIADSFCDLCLYNDGDCNKCSKYPDGKPSDIINDSCNCKKFQKKVVLYYKIIKEN